MTKAEARMYSRKILTTLQSPEHSLQLKKFLSPFLKNKKKVISYRFHPPELNVDFLEKDYPTITFFFPRIVSKQERSLEFIYPISWKQGEYGIFEPQGTEKIEPNQAELCILPCLGSNSRGYRLGRGGGFYDSTMQNLPKQKLIGITLLELSNLDFREEPHDLQFGAVITPNGVFFHEP